MNRVILQRWEESERNWGTRPDGCSLHLDNTDKDKYIKDIYRNRTCDVPDIYERVVGESIEVFIDDSLYNILKKEKSLRLQEYELNNLVSLEELIIKQ